jgi:hypothetical protein
VKKFLYAMTAALISLTTAAAQAENWVEIASTADGDIKQYLDVDSIERHLGTVTLTRVLEYKPSELRKVNGVTYRSKRIQTEFECDSRAMRQKYFSWHSASKGKGVLIEDGSSVEWEIDSFDEFTLPLWKMACE